MVVGSSSSSSSSHEDASKMPKFVNVTVEVPKWSFVKRRADGSVDFVSPVPCPFNYGSVLSIPAPDGDPLDALILGEFLAYGVESTQQVVGVVKFVDAGFTDNKLVCTTKPSVRNVRRGLMGARKKGVGDSIDCFLKQELSLLDSAASPPSSAPTLSSKRR